MRDLNELAIFEAIVAEGGLSGASRKLGVPKSTVSRKLHLLEARLGVRLVDRTSRRVEPTETGLLLVERCREMLAVAEEAETAVASLQDEPSGTLRITTPNSFGHSFIGTLVAGYAAACPNVDLDIVVTNDILDLVAERFDLAVRVGPLEDSTLVARRWLPAPRMVVASPDCLERYGPLDTVDDLRSVPVIVVPGIVWRFGAAPDFDPRCLRERMTINDIGFARRMALAGAGATILPLAMCHEELSDGRLRRVLDGMDLFWDNIYLVTPSRSWMPRKTRAFIDLFAEAARRPPPWAAAAGALGLDGGPRGVSGATRPEG